MVLVESLRVAWRRSGLILFSCLCAAMRPLAVAVLTVMLLSWLQVEVEACSDAQTLVHASAALQAIYTRVPRSRGCKHDLNLSEHKPRLGLLASYNASTLAQATE